MNQMRSFSPRRHLMVTWNQNYLFWLMSLGSSCLIFLNRKADRGLKIVVFFGLFLLLSVRMVKLPYGQYFMFIFPLLSVAVAYLQTTVCDKLKIKYIYRISLIFLLVVVPMRNLPLRDTNDRQLEKIDFVINNTKQTDFVYDGRNEFNLFRKDLHYFGHSVARKKGLTVYNKLTDGKYSDYNIYRLIREKKPVIISNHRIKMPKYGLSEMYVKTEFDDVYILEKEKEQEPR